MESTEESETDQPFLVTEMEKALNDKVCEENSISITCEYCTHLT